MTRGGEEEKPSRPAASASEGEGRDLSLRKKKRLEEAAEEALFFFSKKSKVESQSSSAWRRPVLPEEARSCRRA